MKPYRPLSPQETIIFRLMLQGAGCKEMTQIAHLELGAVHFHRANVLKKFGRTSAAKLCADWWRSETLALGIDLLPFLKEQPPAAENCT